MSKYIKEEVLFLTPQYLKNAKNQGFKAKMDRKS